MTYFGFLLIFVGVPIFVLLGITYWDRRRGVERNGRLVYWPAGLGIALHMLIALVYTTPWDNYLVATKVWWYDPNLVTNIVIGWVPIEEYTFFIIQPILAGLWLWLLARRLKEPTGEGRLRSGLRWKLPVVLGAVWAAMVVILLGGWEPGTYLALELGWALPPIMLQLAFGADILWRYRRIVLLSLVPLTLYLSGADALAIEAGTWTINPAQSLDVLLGGVLPVEEFIFFLLTNTLLTFGLTLLWAAESHERILAIRRRLGRASQNERSGSLSSDRLNV